MLNAKEWIARKGPCSQETALKHFHDVVARYGEPHRRYHNLHHIQSLLSLLKVQIAECSDIYWAVMYHDAIYTPTSQTNESESARLAHVHLLEMGIDPCPTERMILATKNHTVDAARSEAEQAFLDADMSILGAPPALYQNYLTQIRQEYQQITDEQFALGRARFIQKTLLSGSIYGTRRFINIFEKQAELNLNDELRRIEMFLNK